MPKKSEKMELVNPNTSGIDIGTRSQFVAIGQGDEDVRVFWVYNEDLKAIAVWLKERENENVAMESSGTYWQS